MKVFSIYYTHKPGGFCKRLYRLLNALDNAGHSVCYLTLDPEKAQLNDRIEVKKIPFPLKARNGVLFWLIFSYWAPLYFAFSAIKAKPDRLVVFGAYYSFIALLARLFSRAKLVLFVRSLVFKINRITEKPAFLCMLSDLLEKMGIRAADRVVAMSNSMASELKTFSGRHGEIEILPNDVPARSENPAPLPEKLNEKFAQKKFFVLTSGVFDQRKNLDFLLKTFEHLRGEPIELLVAGSLKSAEPTSINPAVTFLGWIDYLNALYPQIQLLLHPSLHEGMPNSVLEAWSYGTPALVAPTPELKEMAPYDSLWLTETTPEALAKRLIAISGNPEIQARLKQDSEAAAKRLTFNWDESAVKLALN